MHKTRMIINNVPTKIQKQPLFNRVPSISRIKFNKINNALPAKQTRQIAIIPRMIINNVINPFSSIDVSYTINWMDL